LSHDVEDLPSVKEIEKEIEKEMEKYLTLANLADAFVDLKPEHPLYHSIRKDLKDCLFRLKNPAKDFGNE